MNIQEILAKAVESQASDVFLVTGLPISFKIHRKIERQSEEKLMPNDSRALLTEIYQLANNRDLNVLDTKGDDDFAFAIPNLSRFRVSAYKQRGTLSAVIRVVSFTLPDYKKRRIPESIMDLSKVRKGMILVTGPAGSGKSTTLACVIDRINQTRESHIITLEDPIEYLHRHSKSVVSQREISVDTENYVTALRAALRQSPDVILLGEMRDYETIDIAMTAAETGHLLFSTLHTIGAANTIDRIIDVFPVNQQKQISVQLSLALNTIISQQLVPTIEGKSVPAFEIMTVTPAIRNLIRDGKIPQIEAMLYSSNQPDMISMDQSLLSLFKEGLITKETALTYATNAEMLGKKLQ